LKIIKIFIIILFPYLLHAQNAEHKIYGMLIGSAIGDAAGGPIEFVHPPLRNCWSKTSTKLSPEAIIALADSFKLRTYPKNAEPFAQWEDYAPAGTITDDTRFKIIFFNTLKHHNGKLTEKNFATEVLHFRDYVQPAYQAWFDKWIPEIAYATRWVLGERNQAYPPERIWGGIPTMIGQMPFIPVAALNPNNPEWCYLKCYELGYFDIGFARDMNSSLIAGLARALQPDGNWENAEQAMRETDPYNYNNVLYVPRQLNEWLDKSHCFVKRADGNVAKLFEILEKELHTQTWWESWVPIVVVYSIAEIAQYNPLASMQLVLEFGHDTDSYAQVMGAFMGAIHGPDIFPKKMRNTINDRMKEQFGQNINDWMILIDKYNQ